MSAKIERLGGKVYWRCRTGEHLWVHEEDATCCCDPGFSRTLISRGEAVGKHHTKSSVDGFVFVWLPVGRS